VTPPETGSPAASPHSPPSGHAAESDGSGAIHVPQLAPPLDALCTHTPPAARASVARALGVLVADVEDVPFAVELRDGDPGLMFKQARA